MSGKKNEWFGIAVAIVATLISCTGCATLDLKIGKKDKKSDKSSENALDSSPMLIPVGTVHFVDPGGQFVLIRSMRSFNMDEGTEISTFGSNGILTSRLKLSPARKGSFLSADILEGRPVAGDQALRRYSLQQSQANDPFAPGGRPEDEVQVLE